MSTRKKAPARKKVAAKRKPPANVASRASAVRAPKPLEPELIQQAVRSKRFLAADRARLDLGEIASWDTHLLREHRLLVPIDVQALYVEPGSSEPMVPLPLLLAGANGKAVDEASAGLPPPFSEGVARPAGVHLHWAMPDALLRGKLQQRTDGSANRLSLPVLPDRWTVLRILLPQGARAPVITGWVLEAERAIAVPLGSWAEGSSAAAAAVPAGVAIAREQLTGTVGGAVSWSTLYDAVLNRFAFHDPLSDLPSLAANGVDQDCVSYLVTGWWSDPKHDVLDRARNNASLHELLDELRWGLLAEWGDEQLAQQKEQAEFALKKELGLTTADRWSSPRPLVVEKATRAPDNFHVSPIDTVFLEQPKRTASSAFFTEVERRFVAEPWHLRSSLLHGSIFGVPVRGAAAVDRRPAADQLAVALGQHDDDLLAAFASPAQATLGQRRARELLLSAFTAQKVARIGSPDGLVELEEYEHATGFSSQPGGTAGTDRFLQRVQTGGAGGLAVGKQRSGGSAAAKSAKARAEASFGAELMFARDKPRLQKASAAKVKEIARSRVGEVLSPVEARVAKRPAARFTFANPPVVAIRGAERSLRHGGDGRASEDGKLMCRWPTQVVNEISGLVAPDFFVRSLGNGSIPPETLQLAREAVLYDPYHGEWITNAITPPNNDRKLVFARLQAESALRFGADGVYDGATSAFHATLDKAAKPRAVGFDVRPGSKQQARMVADELRKFSLYKGADPDLVGVTTWAQPWIPMWLEWEAAIEGLDPATLEAWQLEEIELIPRASAFAGAQTVLRGRALLTTGAAATLHAAVRDWLKAEDALDSVNAGLVDEATEASLRSIDEAVQRLDVITAALDELHPQLLGLPVSAGLVRPNVDGAIAHPAPVTAPHALWAGTITLTRARLLDTFGRTLEVPLAEVATPTRNTLSDRPGVLLQPPRLLRPARWQFRLVDAATAVGAEGAEARVDQVDPTLQINPVAGFLMPDHLDESLELFGIDGAPIGELLHEAVSGGVLWEIAAGRPGPADSGPLYGLAPAQQTLGRLAAGLVAADAAARQGTARAPDAPGESALSALLRAIDTTLWTVDSFAALGSEHIAGLVGRPVAVARAQLRLELQPADDVDLTDPARAAEWKAAEQLAAQYAFPVRIGELTRSDDGVLGFFVDDDFSRFRIVDKVIAGVATEAGRSRGQLGLITRASGMPAGAPIDNPYILGSDDADTLMLHVGQTVTLTLLMHPAGKASLTSGLLPRKALALARDWVAPGLAALAPSLRTGPVLVETDLDTESQVRLPKISVFGTDQNFLWRDTPSSWRTDAILAATQSALLPDSPAELREGWIRVAPDLPKSDASKGGGAA